MSPDLLAFLLSIVCGAVIMLAWDILHALRTVLFKGIVTNILLDMIWWIFACTAVVLYTWQSNHLSLRFFVFFALGIGAFLYCITVSRLIRRLFCYIFGTVFKIFKFIFKILLTPALFLYKILLDTVFVKHNRTMKRGDTK